MSTLENLENLKNLKVGDKVVCVNVENEGAGPVTSELTLGKTYEIAQDFDGICVYVINNDGKKFGYFTNRFEPVIADSQKIQDVLNKLIQMQQNVIGNMNTYNILQTAINDIRKNVAKNFILTKEEKELIISDQKIAAIKAIRSRSGLGLKESKDIVDAWFVKYEAKYEAALKNLVETV